MQFAIEGADFFDEAQSGIVEAHRLVAVGADGSGVSAQKTFDEDFTRKPGVILFFDLDQGLQADLGLFGNCLEADPFLHSDRLQVSAERMCMCRFVLFHGLPLNSSCFLVIWHLKITPLAVPLSAGFKERSPKRKRSYHNHPGTQLMILMCDLSLNA